MNRTYPPLVLNIESDIMLAEGDVITAAPAGSLVPGPILATETKAPRLPAGTRLSPNDMDNAFMVLTNGFTTAHHGPATHCLTLRALADLELPAGTHEFTAIKPGVTLAWIVLSDKGAAGKRVDECGPLIEATVGMALDIAYIQGFLIPDDTHELKALVTDLCLTQRFDLVITSGGTGVGPRDITPEATLDIIEKRLPGYERAMTQASLAKTPHGAISRAVAGTLGTTLIINMPGSPKAVAENLDPLVPTLNHTIKKLQGDPSDCATLRDK